ncbi:unnamed protein product [Phytophthora fragariaefolia]|uniref:Unnamed protein product n=1 Tax=Phytophthora fragariaefolia TaxID=1490495 RepID=A0A9W6X5K0_9STRA|nr:unnamed protein product [Phytophthora fragariaefolia]
MCASQDATDIVQQVTTDRARVPYQKLMSDECFLNEPTYNGYLHFQLVLDEATHYVWGFLLKRKEEAAYVVMKHVAWILARGHRVEAFGSDGGGELIKNPGQPGLFLEYGKESMSYRVLDLKTGKVKELRTVEFAENWTVEYSYVEKLLLNRYKGSKYQLLSRIPFVGLDDLTSPSPTRRPLGDPERYHSDEHRDKRHCSEDLRDKTRTVVEAPFAVDELPLANSPAGGTSSADPTGAARSTRVRGLRELDHVPQHEDTDGDGGAEGGGNLPNRSCSAPFEDGGALSDSDVVDNDPDWSDSDDDPVDTVIANGDPEGNIPRSAGAGREADDEADEARLTVKDCQQEFGINFWETYAPVAKIESVRFLLLLALELGLLCRQVDFVTAFLNGPIGEADIYMEQPDYVNDGSGRVCKLQQSLYGLRQAPRIWYRMLDKYLRKCGFKRTKMDAGVYVRTVGANKVYVAVYVDDLLIVGKEPDIEMVIAELRSKFKIKDLGNVKHLLGMEITYVPGRRLTISQKGYCEKILARFKMQNCKPVPTPQVKGNFPMPGNPDVEPVCVNDDPEIDYRQIVGSLHTTCLQRECFGTCEGLLIMV